jgi:hypothetical protein
MSLYSSSVSRQPRHVYYNLTLSNGSAVPTLAEVTDNRNAPIINNPSEYMCTIAKFSCQTNSIPLQIVPIMPYPNVDVNKTVYSVSLSYGAFSAHEHVMHVPTEMKNGVLLQPKQALSASYTQPDSEDHYYYLRSIQSMVNCVNTAFSDAFDTLAGLTTLPAGAVAPFFTYDAGSYLFTLHSQVLYYEDSLSDKINVYVNTPLFSLFSAINNVSDIGNPDGMEYRYVITNNHDNIYPNNSPLTDEDMIFTTQEHPTLINWMSFAKLVFMTNSIPIVNEDTPLPIPYFTNDKQPSGLPASSPIVTDFDPVYDIGVENLNLIQYTPSTYRFIDMTGNTPLTRINLKLYWQDKYNNLHELEQLPNDSAAIKIGFFDKQYVVN